MGAGGSRLGKGEGARGGGQGAEGHGGKPAVWDGAGGVEHNFTATELGRIERRFRRLCQNGSSEVAIREFSLMSELAGNPFAERIFQIFDANEDGMMSLEEFTMALASFKEMQTEDQKYRFALKVYDVDGDGFVSESELFNTIRMAVGRSLSDNQLEQIVQKTMIEYDADGDGKLSFEEFKELVSTSDLKNKLEISF